MDHFLEVTHTASLISRMNDFICLLSQILSIFPIGHNPVCKTRIGNQKAAQTSDRRSMPQA
ncbi:hypothetical protein GCWU000342_00006 [Shuttleworthella satelles DSM 14600]|uniref:Uncharacterized protein n=1 Tax=Shuttleworthella satelles DSM 14600 TaxID=626523 RepID=C4GA88_9FIRM|nr:hypothetical protein GCWU000342_00006 [Shuttleworthia satelles DSM 14600]